MTFAIYFSDLEVGYLGVYLFNKINRTEMFYFPEFLIRYFFKFLEKYIKIEILTFSISFVRKITIMSQVRLLFLIMEVIR